MKHKFLRCSPGWQWQCRSIGNKNYSFAYWIHNKHRAWL